MKRVVVLNILHCALFRGCSFCGQYIVWIAVAGITTEWSLWCKHTITNKH